MVTSWRCTCHKLTFPLRRFDDMVYVRDELRHMIQPEGHVGVQNEPSLVVKDAASVRRPFPIVLLLRCSMSLSVRPSWRERFGGMTDAYPTAA